MSTSEDCPPWELLDAFCGGGLASSGFRAAGMRLVGAVDSSPEALSVYKLNFATRVSCATLGPSLEEYQFPAPRPQLHVHLSPPCTELSNAKSGPRSGQGMELLAWSVETAVCYESFSIETVHTSQTLAFARDATERQPEHIAWGVYDAVNFGAAQARVRLVIATPAIIRRLNEAPAAVRLSIDDAFRAAGATIPAGSTHVKNSSAVVDGTNIRPITGPAFTCCASRALSFCTSTGQTTVSMRPEHTRVLMGLPTSFALSGKQRVDQRVLGNGVVFGLSRAIALAAMGLHIEPLQSYGEAWPPRKRTTDDHCSDDLEARLRRVERRLARVCAFQRRACK